MACDPNRVLSVLTVPFSGSESGPQSMAAGEDEGKTLVFDFMPVIDIHREQRERERGEGEEKEL